MRGNCNEAFEVLANDAEGRLAGETRARLEALLATGCPQCQQALAWLRRAVRLMRSDTLVTPPRRVVERAIKLFKEPHAMPARTIARLLFDSLLGSYLQPSSVGVRSGGATSRQVLYGSEELDVDLLIEKAEACEPPSGWPRQSRVNLLGQVLRRGGHPDPRLYYKIAMMRASECLFSGHTNPLGEFVIDHLQRADPQAALRVAEVILRICASNADHACSALSSWAKANALRELGDYDRALSCYADAGSMFGSAGQPVDVASTLIGKVDPLMYLSRYGEASAAARRAKRLLLKHGQLLQAAKLDANTGYLFHPVDRYGPALQRYNRARRAFFPPRGGGDGCPGGCEQGQRPHPSRSLLARSDGLSARSRHLRAEGFEGSRCADRC